MDPGSWRATAPSVRLAASKIEHELGWVPEETFETGLRKTVQWYLDNTSWWERVLSGAYRMDRIGVDI